MNTVIEDFLLSCFSLFNARWLPAMQAFASYLPTFSQLESATDDLACNQHIAINDEYLNASLLFYQTISRYFTGN